MPFKDSPEGQTQYLDENGKLVGEIKSHLLSYVPPEQQQEFFENVDRLLNEIESLYHKENIYHIMSALSFALCKVSTQYSNKFNDSQEAIAGFDNSQPLNQVLNGLIMIEELAESQKIFMIEYYKEYKEKENEKTN